ncbi:MAG: hypothetical protein AB1758_34740, partial [Candidatus Eremiobacterota bacterium]
TPSKTPNPAATQAFPKEVELAPASRSNLRNYYIREKYPEAERRSVQDLVELALTAYAPEEKGQAVAEILAYNHVVFHTTEFHDLNRNHALMRRHEELLKKLCKDHEVPFLPVLAITSWENSGDADKVSWADAAGLGQMTWGAVDQAHAYSQRIADEFRIQARLHKDLAAQSKDPKERREAARYSALADRFDLARRHRQLTHQAGLEDERLVPECCLEDSVVFFKYLLEMYGGRVDLAIVTYHNGVQNSDDMLFDYVSRREPSLARPGPNQRGPFLEALSRHNVNFLTLWNDLRCRQMLNGLRTMEGEITEPATAHLALGDESDIYLWKVLGSLAAYQSGPEYTRDAVSRYDGERDFVEVEGLTSHTSLDEFRKAVRASQLVRVTAPIADGGIGGEAKRGTDPRLFSFYITPELDGYLWSLANRMRQASGNPKLRLPVSRLSMAHLTAARGTFDLGEELHLKGVAVEVLPAALPDGERAVLRQLVNADYLMDRVYRTQSKDGRLRLCLNPRWGEDFLAVREKYRAAMQSPSAGSN